MKIPYTKVAEEAMKKFYDSLSEKDKRRYAAVEVIKLMHGAKTYIANVLKCDYKTIESGLEDLEDQDELKKKE
jgi:hypothetical protein